MNAPLRDRINRKLDTLSDERLYQVLDYVEFLESRYAQRQAPASNVFQRFAETVEDRLRAGKVSATTIAETMSLMNKAMGVLNGVAAAGKSVANDIVGAATRPAGTTTPAPTPTPAPPPSASPTPPAAPAPPTSTAAEPTTTRPTTGESAS
ncbi:MAG TPA: hypothetical protein VFJ74_16390 [Gemmatimonadaceae bacterium]|nr:hypothetical protein [Gemmatimonadaceae bacterium]